MKAFDYNQCKRDGGKAMWMGAAVVVHTPPDSTGDVCITNERAGHNHVANVINLTNILKQPVKLKVWCGKSPPKCDEINSLTTTHLCAWVKQCMCMSENARAGELPYTIIISEGHGD